MILVSHPSAAQDAAEFQPTSASSVPALHSSHQSWLHSEHYKFKHKLQPLTYHDTLARPYPLVSNNLS
jgi:hypothetical protein